MKRKEAIKKFRNGEVQIHNDLLPSTKEIKKLLKKAFPKDGYDFTDSSYNIYYKSDFSKWNHSRYEIDGIKTVNLSSISKSKNKLKKKVSELAKDVAELKQKDWGSIIPSEQTKDLECDFENVKQVLEINKWYKNIKIKDSNTLINLKVNKEDEKHGYGLHSGMWSNSWGMLNYEDYILAIPEEVGQALIQEANKRGFVDGVSFCSILEKNVWTLSGDIEFVYNEKENTLEMWSNLAETKHDNYKDNSRGKSDVFINGIWAEIIEQPKEETPIKEE